MPPPGQTVAAPSSRLVCAVFRRVASLTAIHKRAQQACQSVKFTRPVPCLDVLRGYVSGQGSGMLSVVLSCPSSSKCQSVVKKARICSLPAAAAATGLTSGRNHCSQHASGTAMKGA